MLIGNSTARVAENPPMVPFDVETLTTFVGTWWVAHTKSRFEKVFAWDLVERGIGYFLPMVWRAKISGGRKRRFLLPLFPSYVFFCGDDEDRYTAMTTKRLCQAIKVVDQNDLVTEMAAIERALNGKATLDPYPFAAVGRRCRITSGALRGIEGVVVQRNKLARIVLEVTMLGQGVVMEVNADLLEPAD